MRKRIIRDALFILAVPLTSIILLSRFSGTRRVQLVFVVCGALIQLIVVLMCMKNMMHLMKPDIEYLLAEHVERVPAPYEPGRFDTDYKIFTIAAMLGTLTPILTYLARLYTRTITVSALNIMTYESPDMNLLILSLVSWIGGALAFVLWAKIGQARVIANEGSDSKRYLYMGYAEMIDEK